MIAARLWPCALLFLFLAPVGCTKPPAPPGGSERTLGLNHSLSAIEAAELAARLANDECERLYQKRPFTPDQHAAVLKDGVYRWGRLDVGGRGGFSAVVTFRADGSQPHVEVYFSTDQRLPLR